MRQQEVETYCSHLFGVCNKIATSLSTTELFQDRCLVVDGQAFQQNTARSDFVGHAYS